MKLFSDAKYEELQHNKIFFCRIRHLNIRCHSDKKADIFDRRESIKSGSFIIRTKIQRLFYRDTDEARLVRAKEVHAIHNVVKTSMPESVFTHRRW